MKNEKGMSLMDAVISILILSIFVGIIGTLFYEIGINSSMVKSNALATHYAVKVAEDIDRIPYENVTKNYIENTLIPTYHVEQPFNITVEVDNYNEDDDTKEDILKIVTIQVGYNFMNRNETYEVKKLKVIEF